MRSTPTFFRAADGTPYLFVSGNTKTAVSATTSTAPPVQRLKIVTTLGQPAYLAIDAADTNVLLTPGSPVITSDSASNGAIIWILAANITRGQSLLSSTCPHPILIAEDASSLNTLFSSTQAETHVGGKYTTPTIAHGVVFIGTDRIQAFAVNPARTAVIAIQCGSKKAVGAFIADTDFTGGHAIGYTMPVDTSSVIDPAPQAVYESKRAGSNKIGFTYIIPGLIAGAIYKVRLHFTDTVSKGPGQRLFNVSINGTQVLTNFDIVAAAGGTAKAVIKEFTATADSSGGITLAYTYGQAGDPLSCGIEVVY